MQNETRATFISRLAALVLIGMLTAAFFVVFLPRTPTLAAEGPAPTAASLMKVQTAAPGEVLIATRGYSNLIASYYAITNFTSLVTTTAYNAPIDFVLWCTYSSSPFEECKLNNAQPTGNIYSVRWVGSIFIPVSGTYTFTLAYVDDEAQLLIDDNLVVNGGWDTKCFNGGTDYSGSNVITTTGAHVVRIEYRQCRAGKASLRAQWAGPGFANEIIPMAGMDRDRRWGPGCPLCGETDASVGGPINTFNGNYNYMQQDLSIPALGQPLRVERSYNAQSSDLYTKPLGYGWTHNYGIRLITSTTQPGGEAGLIVFQGWAGGRFRFLKNTANGVYTPLPGIRATLTRTLTAPYTYTLTTVDQTIYTFNAAGLPVTIRDPRGNLTNLTYTGTQLIRVADATGQRYLNFGYDGQGRVFTMTDPINRSITYTYDINGNLSRITDTRGFTWTYVYTGTNNHLLAEVRGPYATLVERTDYDSQKRAVRQWTNTASQPLGLQYLNGVDTYGFPTQTVVISDPLGRITFDNYNARGTLVGQQRTEASTARGDDAAFNWADSTDANQHSTGYLFQPTTGLPLVITDAATFTTNLQYDSLNNPTLITDTRNFTTAYVYSGTLLTRQIDALGNTTVYTYGPSNLLIAQQDALGRVTRYEYSPYGQRIVMTDALTNTTRFAYDLVGRLITTTDAIGRMTVNAYDNADHVIAVTNNYTTASTQQNYLNTYNLITRYGYDGFGRQIAVTDTLSHVTRSYFDPAGRLISTTQNFSPTVGQNYLNTWNLITRYGYDAVGNQIAVTDTLGFVTRTDYDNLNRPITVTQNYKDGVFDVNKPDEDVQRITRYDPAGNVLEQIDPSTGSGLGSVTRNWYDSLNRVISTTANYTTTPGVDPNTTNLTTWYEYDPAGNQVAITDTLLHVTRNYYDPIGRLISTTVNYRSDVGPNYLNTYNLITRYEYDRVGNRTAITDALGTPTRYGYDQLNRVIATTNVSGTTSTQYDALGNRVMVIDALTHTTVYTYNAVGQLSKMRDAGGNVTAYGYDALGRTIVVTDALNRATRTYYDDAGRVVSTTNALTGTTVMVYDALGRRSRTQDARGNWTDYQYDGLGRTIVMTDATGSVLQYKYDAVGNRTQAIDGLNHPMTSTYDAANRLIKMQDAGGNTTQYGYDRLGNRTVMTDANGVVTRYGYDALSRLIAVTESVTSTVGLDPAKYNVVTRYGYDALSNRIAMTDALTHTTAYTYDLLSRLIMMQDARGSLTRYLYDAVGNRTKVIDANNQTITYTYDALDRNTKIDYGTSVVTFEYDKVGNRTTMTDSVGVTRYVYDELNRLKQVTDPFTGTVQYRYDAASNRTQTIYPDGKVVTYTFDAANRLTGTLSWDGQLTTYAFDKAGRLVTTTLPNGMQSVNRYDDAGRLINLTHTGPYWQQATYTYTLDAVGNRLAVIEHVLPPTPLNYLPVIMKDFDGSGGQMMLPGGQTTPFVSPLPFQSPLPPASSLPPHNAAVPVFDPSLLIIAPVALAAVVARKKGRKGALFIAVLTGALVIVGQTHTSRVTSLPLPFVSPLPPPPGCVLPTAIGDTRVISYTYDPLYRLSQAAYSSGECYQYSYDRVGNRTAMTTTIATITYQYDPANRLINAGGATYTWDNNGNLLNDGSALYRYDRANRLISTTLNSTTSLFNYNGDGVRLKQVIAGVVTTYTQDVAAPLPVVLQAKTGVATTKDLYSIGTRPVAQNTTAWEYLLPDALGSVRQIASANGYIIRTQDFEPYGSLLNGSGSGTSVYDFTGEERDPSGLIFLRARYMQPRLGVFLSRDPWSGEAIQPGSMNGFNYVEGNPVNRVDSSGQVSEDERKYMHFLYDNFIEDVVVRLHDPLLTNLSDDAFAAMIAAKFLVEDATDYADNQPAGTQRARADQVMLAIPDWASLAIQAVSHQRYSWGPANIHSQLAQRYFDWWEQNHANLPSLCFRFENVETEYYHLRDSWRKRFPFINPALETSPYKQVARELVSDKGAVQGTALAILESSDRARKYWRKIGQPSHELSAYTIALGVIAYNRPDEDLYVLNNWGSKGFAWNWVVEAVPWVANELGLSLDNFVMYTNEEKMRLDQLPLSVILFAGQRWLDAGDSPRSSCVDQIVQDAEILRSEQLDVNQDGIKDDVVVYGQDNIYVLVVINQTTSDCKIILNDRLASRQLRSGDRRTVAIRQVELVDLTGDNQPELHIWLDLRSDDYRTSDALHKIYQLQDGTMKMIFVISQCLEMSSFEFRTAPDGSRLIYLDEDRRCDPPSSSRGYEMYQWSTKTSQFERIESGQIAKATPDSFWSALLVVYVLPVTAIIVGVVLIGLIMWLRSKKRST